VYHVSRQDIALVAQSLNALLCFDGASQLVQVRRGISFLLETQNEDGSWRQSEEEDIAQVYFTSMNAALALRDPVTMGFAPSIPELVPMLEVHLSADVENMVSALN
jgi:hypothetical protein